MRLPQYLSPSSISTFNENNEEFYLKYMADDRPPKIAQTEPMSVGSAFDAYCKSYLHQSLFGPNHPDSNKFLFESIFDSQVEDHNRDFAREAGLSCFKSYKDYGCLSDLMTELSSSDSAPRFEFSISGTVKGLVLPTAREIEAKESLMPRESWLLSPRNPENQPETVDQELGNGVSSTQLDQIVVLLGKPDCYYTNKAGVNVILDWKVNGYCSNSNVSPAKGYVNLRPGNKSHKDCLIVNHRGSRINCNVKMEEVDRKWAGQLAVYAWLCGAPVGSDYVSRVDQLCFDGKGGCRVANHSCLTSTKFQHDYYTTAQKIWDYTRSGYILRDRNEDEARKRQETLDGMAQGLSGETTNDEWLRRVTRTQSNF